MADLEDVIVSSLEDSQLPEEPTETPVEDPIPTEPVEAAPEPAEEPTEPTPETVPAQTEPTSSVEDFDKRFGIPARTPDGSRENRIPYSRVKKITEKAVNDALATKSKELEGTYTPKIQEYETKIKDYEEKLDRVNRFEQVMVNKPDQFLTMLSNIPAYAPFFKALEEAFSNEPLQSGPVTDDMPQPDQQLEDGSMVYSMDGLKSLLSWQANQVEQRVTQQVTERYKPIESEWQAHQRVQAVIPQVQAQIAEARTWRLFNENEDEIVKVLQAEPKISLEGAYRKVVLPKIEAERTADVQRLTTDRNKIREEILKELRQAPKATSATTGASRSAPTPSTGPRDLEDVIAEAVKTIK